MTNIKKATRVPEIDLMKGVVIISMVMVHTLECSWESLANADKGLGYLAFYLIEFTGGVFCSGAFAFGMGWGAAFSERTTPGHFLYRFLKYIILGLFVNFAQFYIPSLIDPEFNGAVADTAYSLIAVDILFYAAMFMLVFVVFSLLKGNTVAKIAISAVIVIVFFAINTFIPSESYTTGNGWLDTLIGLFIRENDYSFFPLATWSIYPFMGYWFGVIYRRMDDRKRFAKLMLLMGIPALALSEIMVTINDLPHEILNPGGYDEPFFYAMHSWSVVGGFGLICIEIVLFMGILKLLDYKLPKFFALISKDVTFIYVMQWVILGFIATPLGSVSSIWVNILVAICVLATVFVLSALKNRILERTSA